MVVLVVLKTNASITIDLIRAAHNLGIYQGVATEDKFIHPLKPPMQCSNPDKYVCWIYITYGTLEFI